MIPQFIFQSLVQIRPMGMRSVDKQGKSIGGQIKSSSRVLYGTELVSSGGATAKYGPKQADNGR